MADLGTILVDGNASSPRNWNTQSYLDIDEGIGSADGSLIAAGTTGATGVVDTAFTLGNTPSDLSNVDTLSYNVRYRINLNSSSDDTVGLEVRIVNGATILAAGASDGTFQVVLAAGRTPTTWTNSNATAFTYVNTTATKAQWDGAQIEFRNQFTKAGKTDTNSPYMEVDTVELTGTYSTASPVSVALVAATATLAAQALGVTIPFGGPAFVAQGTAYNTADTATTAHNIAVPGSMTNGNCLLVILCIDGTGTASSTDLTEIYDSAHSTASTALWVGYREVDGTEGSTVLVTSSVSEQAYGWAVEIENWDGNAPEVSGTKNEANSLNPDSPSFTPTGGAQDRLGISIHSKNGGTGGYTVAPYPSGNTATGTTGGSGSAGGGYSMGNETGATVDPSAWTITGTANDWMAISISLEAGGGTSIALTAATATLAAQALDLSLTAKSIGLTQATATVAAQALGVDRAVTQIPLVAATPSVAAQALGLSLSPKSVALAAATPSVVAQALDLSLTAYSTPLVAATSTVGAQALDLSLSPKSVALVAATPSVVAQALGLSLTAKSITLVTATGTIAAQALDVTIGGSPVTVALIAATPTLAAQALGLSLTAKSISLQPGTATVAGQALDLSLGAKSIGLQPSIATIAGQALDLSLTAKSIDLQPGTLTAGPQALGLSLDPLSVALSPGTLTATAQVVDVSRAALEIALTSATLDAVAQSLGLSLSAKSVALTAGTLTISARVLGVDNGVADPFQDLRIVQTDLLDVW